MIKMYKDLNKKKKWLKKHYKIKKDYYITKQRKRREKMKLLYTELKKKYKCIICGESESCCIDFHHLDPDKKDFDISDGFRRSSSIKRIQEEIDKCISVCKNCHAKIHNDILVPSSSSQGHRPLKWVKKA
jgi:transcription elongation factor Elf1